jgi:hypothetical protein
LDENQLLKKLARLVDRSNVSREAVILDEHSKDVSLSARNTLFCVIWPRKRACETSCRIGIYCAPFKSFFRLLSSSRLKRTSDIKKTIFLQKRRSTIENDCPSSKKEKFRVESGSVRGSICPSTSRPIRLSMRV